MVEALILAAVATDVSVDPALPLGHQSPGFPRASAGRPSVWIERRGRGGRRGCVPGRGDPLAVGAYGDLVGGACSVVAGGDDAPYQLRGIVAGAAAHDVRAVGLLGVFVVAFGDPLIQVGGVGVAAARAGLDGAQRCGRHPRTRSPSSQCARFGKQTATGPGGFGIYESDGAPDEIGGPSEA